MMKYRDSKRLLLISVFVAVLISITDDGWTATLLNCTYERTYNVADKKTSLTESEFSISYDNVNGTVRSTKYSDCAVSTTSSDLVLRYECGFIFEGDDKRKVAVKAEMVIDRVSGSFSENYSMDGKIGLIHGGKCRLGSQLF